MDKGWTAAVEVAECLSHLSKDVNFSRKWNFFLLMFLQIAPQTDVHLLKNQYRNARARQEENSKELHDVGVY